MAAVIGNPEITVLVHSQFVRADEQSCAKTFQQLALGVELEYRCDRRIGASACGAASSERAAAIHDPDRSVRRHRHARARAPFASRRQLTEVDTRLVEI